MAEKRIKEKNTKERKQLLNLLCSLGDHSRLVCSVQCIGVCVSACVHVCTHARAKRRGWEDGSDGKMLVAQA